MTEPAGSQDGFGGLFSSGGEQTVMTIRLPLAITNPPASASNRAKYRKALNELYRLTDETEHLLFRIGSLEEQRTAEAITSEDGVLGRGRLDEHLQWAMGDLSEIIHQLCLEVSLISERMSAFEEKRRAAHGRMMICRRQELEQILRRCGGSLSFRELQSEMKLSPSQFTRVVNSLDKGTFEVRRCPGAKRGEKMVVLK
ncbi:MAG TPA: hypothetical protein PLI05_04790 [Methanotrichaceae archaeon]|nr:hypothetical protein [Methanotrichaceae archaeon]HQF16368.1 hypothetical protein [Methanotrichaceae archaeon]HQI91018.1 hypothetical protein [Methanotrichaceae archaeon]